MNVVVSVAFSAVALAASLAACAARPQARMGGPPVPLPRVALAPSPASVLPSVLSSGPLSEPSPPRPDFASVAQGPPPPLVPPPSAQPSCRGSMILVEGEYCTEVRQECVQWEDPPASTLARCARFAPSQCVGERVHKRFCVDRDEYTPPGATLPAGDISWTEAREVCARRNGRLCRETEWEFACEGEQMLPYTTGLDRNPGACNIDKGDLTDPVTGKLRDQREAAARHGRCVSPFGARNMSGNVDEWVLRDRSGGEWRSALKGGWWMPARDRCRPATTAHDEHFHELQTGLRCCSDAM
jgi:sulfatase modifying factor 1